MGNGLEFNLEDFLKQLEHDVPVAQAYDRVTKILMNTRENQGSIEILPFLSKVGGSFYTKLSSVMEFRCPSKLLDNNPEVWHRILPLEEYEQLTEDQLKLYNETVGLFETLSEKGVYDWSKIRYRDYTLMYGYCINHMDREDNKLSDNIDKACLLIFPSHSIIEALATSIKNKVASAKGNANWVPFVLSPTNKGRQGSLIISFKKASGAGYTSSVGIELNSPYNTVVDPDREFSEEITKHFNDPVRDLLGWQGGEDNTRFNQKMFEDLRDNLKLEVNMIDAKKGEDKSKDIPNKNSNIDGMTNSTSSTAKGVTLPF